MAKLNKRSKKFKSKEKTGRISTAKTQKKVWARGSHKQRKPANVEVPLKSKKEPKKPRSSKQTDADELAEPEDGGFAEIDVDALIGGEFGSDDDDDSEDLKAAASGDEGDEDEMEVHMAELRALEKTDPDFYRHLAESQSELLKFGENEPEAELPQDAEVDEDEGETDAKAEPEAKEEADARSEAMSGRITLAVFRALKKQVMEQRSLRALKRLVRVFRSACHWNDGDKGDNDAALVISDAVVFSELMRLSLAEAPKLLLEQIGGEFSEQPQKSPRWNSLESTCRSFLGNAIHLLQSSVDSSMARLVLARLQPAMLLLPPFAKLCLRLQKALVHLWSTSDDDALRIDAFLALRQLCMVLAARPSFIDAAFKRVYLSFVRNAKFVAMHTAPRVQFMINSIVELYSLDIGAAYRHAFVYLRQIAILLRQKRLDAGADIHTIYNAQILHSMKVWAALLASSTPTSPLRSLIYPFAEITSGLIALNTGAAHLPLHLALLQQLEALSSATSVYIALTSPLLTLLNTATTLPTTSRSSSSAPLPPLSSLVRVKAGQMKQRGFQAALVNALIDTLRAHLTCWSREIAFVELALPVRRRLSELRTAASRLHRFRKAIATLEKQVAANVVWLLRRRAQDGAGVAPCDLEAVETFARDDDVLSPMQMYARSRCSGGGGGDHATKRRKKEQQDALQQQQHEEDEDEDEDDEDDVQEVLQQQCNGADAEQMHEDVVEDLHLDDDSEQE